MPISHKYVGGFEADSATFKLDGGRNFLLCIAIDEYRLLPPLYNCTQDAEAFAQLLIDRYQFEEARITRLYNEAATRPLIFEAFRELIEGITPKDNLVIYYSGHGEYDKMLDEGYWIPVDAALGAVHDYIANDTIRRFIARINSHHTFLVSDSCFAGSLFSKGASKNVSKRYEQDPSRWGLTAGRNEIVSDGQPGMHSPFADALLYRLGNNAGDLGVQQLCSYVVEQVEANANQSPIGEPLKVEGHKNGQFVFHLKKDEARDWAATQQENTIVAYRRFLTAYPEGQFAEEAWWALTEKEDSLQGFLTYLSRFPKGKHQAKAEERLFTLEDEQLWAEADRKNTIHAYRDYLMRQDKGQHREEANRRINELLPAAEPPKARETPAPKKKPPKQDRIVATTPTEPKPSFLDSPLWTKLRKGLLIGLALLIPAYFVYRWASAPAKPKAWDCEANYEQCRLSPEGDYYLVQQGRRFGFVKTNGTQFISTVFEYAEFFQKNDLALVQLKDKWGFLHRSGNMAIQAIYDKAGPFKNGRAQVTLGNETFFIDEKGNRIDQGGGAQAITGLSVGQYAPDFSFVDVDGETYQLSQFKGYYWVLLNFWASWSSPTQRANEELLREYNKVSNNVKLIIINVSLDDDRNAWLKAIDKKGYDWLHTCDLKKWRSDIAELYQVKSIPRRFLINYEGQITYTGDLRGPDLQQALKNL